VMLLRLRELADAARLGLCPGYPMIIRVCKNSLHKLFCVFFSLASL
jgi:hypothetical protein